MYANLLVASMNTDTKEKILPGFVTIIGQLSPDEARLLKLFGENAVIPNLEIRASDKSHPISFKRLLKYFIDTEGLNVNKNYCSLYLDNMCRLNLITYYPDQQLFKKDAYNRLEEKANELVSSARAQYNFEFIRGSIQITDFGREFYALCIG